MHTGTVPAIRCGNCKTQLVGEYCHACGQKRVDADWHSIPRFLREFSDELIHLDFRTVRSVAALFRPGYLPAEFLAGRRCRYLGPLQMYFLCAAIFFLLGPAVSGFNLEELLRYDTDGTLRGIVDAHMARKQMDLPLFAERFDRYFQPVYTMALSVSVVAAALVLRILFRRTVPALAPHLVFSLYYVGFFYLVALLLGGLEQIIRPVHPLASLAITFSVLLPYAFVALRRVYGEPPARTLWKTLAMLAAGLVVDSPVNLGALYLTFALI
jgi:hypothetical protein